MKRTLTILSALALVFTVLTANAQISLGFNGGVGLPMNKYFSNSYNMGYGGSLNAEFNILKIGIGLNAGGYMYKGKDNTTNTLTCVPVILDVKYYFLSIIFKPFVGLGGGKYFEISKGNEPVNYLGLSPEVGFILGFHTKFELSLKYNIVPQGKINTNTKFYNNLGANIGVMFPLGL